MANTPSAKKRVRQIERRTEVKKSRRSRIRTFVRKVEEAIESKDYKIAEQSILENIKTNQRINFKLSVIASSKTGEHIADFILTTSIK